MCNVEFDSDGPSVHRTEVRAARKPWRCLCCGVAIQAGERHRYLFSVHDGDATEERSCLACDASNQAFSDAHGVWLYPSALQEFLSECVVEEDRKSPWRSPLAGILRRKRAAQRAAKMLEGA